MGLSWDCVDFDRGILHIKRQLQKKNGSSGGYVLTTPKNNKPRTISPAPTAMRQLRARSAQQKRDRLRAGVAWDNQLDLVFTNPLGKHLVPEGAALGEQRSDGKSLSGVAAGADHLHQD